LGEWTDQTSADQRRLATGSAPPLGQPPGRVISNRRSTRCAAPPRPRRFRRQSGRPPQQVEPAPGTVQRLFRPIATETTWRWRPRPTARAPAPQGKLALEGADASPAVSARGSRRLASRPTTNVDGPRRELVRRTTRPTAQASSS
jgi:hypothetical protein